MPALKAALADLGYDDVSTYINSGNAIFTTTGNRTGLEREIETKLEETFGFELTTFVRTGPELARLVEAEPFPVSPGDTRFVTFLKQPLTSSQAHDLEALSGEFDTLVVDGRDVHWRMRGKSSDSPLTKRDWKQVLGANSSTSRNVTMLRKLVTKVEG